MKRRIHRNKWGNWRGYEGRQCVIEFGGDDVAAGHWLLTGETERLSGYASDETIKAARQAASEA